MGDRGRGKGGKPPAALPGAELLKSSINRLGEGNKSVLGSSFKEFALLMIIKN